MCLFVFVIFQFVFVAPDITSSTTVHEEMSRHLPTLLRPANTDFLVINKFMHHSSFFFEVMVKSMAQHLLSSGRIKVSIVFTLRTIKDSVQILLCHLFPLSEYYLLLKIPTLCTFVLLIVVSRWLMEQWWMILAWENQVLGLGEPVEVQFCQPQISHGLAQNQTCAFEVSSQ